MKKWWIIFLSLCIACVAWAEAPFGFLPEYEQDNNYQNYALYKITHDMIISYFILEDSEDRPSQKMDAYQSAFHHRVAVDVSAQAAVVGALNEWMSAMRYYIVTENRSEEFADIMPLLKKEIKLRKASVAEFADILFHFTSLEKIKKICGEMSAGCFGSLSLQDLIPAKDRAVFGKISNSKKYFEILVPYVEYVCIKRGTSCQPIHLILLHEMGHFLALSDQYSILEADNKQYLKTPWRLGMKESLMSGRGDKISCDEVDGVINALDYNFSREHNGKYPPRAQKGWKSFCDDTLYKNGEVIKVETGLTSPQK